MEATEQLLTVRAVARLLHFDPRTITRMCDAGELAAVKIRNRWRIQPASVRALLPAKPEGESRDDDTAAPPRGTPPQERVA